MRFPTEIFNSFDNWLIAFLEILSMDSLFTIMGLSYGFTEANKSIVWAIGNRLIWYPIIAGILSSFVIFLFRKFLWKKKAGKIILWAGLIFYFYFTSFGWIMLLT